jgi:hypothetical protein
MMGVPEEVEHTAVAMYPASMRRDMSCLYATRTSGIGQSEHTPSLGAECNRERPPA